MKLEDDPKEDPTWGGLSFPVFRNVLPVPFFYDDLCLVSRGCVWDSPSVKTTRTKYLHLLVSLSFFEFLQSIEWFSGVNFGQD